MPVDPHASVRISAFKWVPPFAQGYVRDLRARWALEEAGVPYAVRKLDAAVVIETSDDQQANHPQKADHADLVADADDLGKAAAEAKRRQYVLEANALANPSSLSKISVEVPSMILTGCATGRLNRIWRWRSTIR